MRTTIVVSALVLLASCSNDRGGLSTVDDGGGGTGGGAGAGGGGGGSGGSGGTPDGGRVLDGPPATVICPTTLPQNGSACPRPNLVCEYGDDVRRDCRPFATCAANGWQITTPRCVAPVPATCPATREAAADKPCTGMNAVCGYDGLNCTCTNCTTGPVIRCDGPTTWHCEAPNMNANCPAGLPRLGSPCTPNGQMCTYACGDNGGRACRDGVWVRAQGGPCPASQRQAKTDIHYLDDAALARVAAQLERVRLATFRYKDPARAQREQLGFIIEDSPDIAAVDREQGMIDLYGYTSMLLAKTQVQDRELRELKREVAALKKAVRSVKR